MYRVTIEEFEIDTGDKAYNAKEINKTTIGSLFAENDDWQRLAEFVALSLRPKMEIQPVSIHEIPGGIYSR